MIGGSRYVYCLGCVTLSVLVVGELTVGSDEGYCIYSSVEKLTRSVGIVR